MSFPNNRHGNTPPYLLSAYGIAVKHGYTGTEEEWLASLKGDQGEYPRMQFDSETGYLQIRYDDSGEWTDIASLADLMTESEEAVVASAKEYADTAEAYAKGTVDGEAVEEGDTGYEDNAKYYAGQASTYASAAGGFATGASNYAQAASGYATTASGHADNAATSATAAAGSATSAAGSATSASNSAGSASTSASAAEAQATQAGTYAYNADQSAQQAASYAAAANTAYGAVVDVANGVDVKVEDIETQVSIAAGYATNAGTSAMNASGSASNAADSATAAAGSASNAADSATAAAGSATAAAGSASSVSESAAQITTNKNDIADLKSAFDEVHVAPEATTFVKMIASEYQTMSFEDIAAVMPLRKIENMGISSEKLVATSNYDCFVFRIPYYGFSFGVNSSLVYKLNKEPTGTANETLDGSALTGTTSGSFKQYTVEAQKGSIIIFEFSHSYNKVMQTKLFNHFKADGLELNSIQDNFLRYAELGNATQYVPVTVTKREGKILNTTTGALSSNVSYDTYSFKVPISQITVTCSNGYRANITTKDPNDITSNGYLVETLYESSGERVSTFTAEIEQWVNISINVNDYSAIDLVTDMVKTFSLPTLRLNYGQKESFYRIAKSGSATYVYICFVSGDKVVQWQLHNVPAAASNSDTWQVGHIMGYDFDGLKLSNGVELAAGGEFELAFKENGAADYCGGNNHGDENTDSFTLHIDGKAIDFDDVDGDYHAFNRIDAIEEATVNRCGEPDEDILSHQKIWTFENGKVTVRQTIKYLEELQVDGMLVTMFPANRTSYTHGVRQGSVTVEDMSEQGFDHVWTKKNDVFYEMYGDNATAKIAVRIENGENVGGIWINDTSDMNKLYYEAYSEASAAHPETVDEGTVVCVETSYDVAYN